MFPDVPVTSKPAEVRMGSGKGSIDYWACRIKPGRILFEIGGVPMELAQEAFRLASRKLPIDTRFVQRSSRGG
jgi:large subunit ribosomal protein L16